LSGADLSGARLVQADLSHTNLRGANLTGADLTGARLAGTQLEGTIWRKAKLSGMNLEGISLSGLDMEEANFEHTNLNHASLISCWLHGARFRHSSLQHADLTGTMLEEADLTKADLTGAKIINANLARASLTSAVLEHATLIDTCCASARLSGCRVFGVSAWRLDLDEADQSTLIISAPNEPEITVDHLEVAQFIHLLLNNDKIRHVIDTITAKVVLILGRFTPARKKALNEIRKKLRQWNYLPILFDFEKPVSEDFTETITLLARMSRFIIADLTEPSSLPKELEAIVPTLAVPVQPLLEGSTRPFSMFKDYWKYDWVLKVHRYEDLNDLLGSLNENVITPAEVKRRELMKRRNTDDALG
jgi:hypothetical protein